MQLNFFSQKQLCVTRASNFFAPPTANAIVRTMACFFISLLTISASSASHAQNNAKNKPKAPVEAENQHSIGDFGVQLYLTASEDKFKQAWLDANESQEQIIKNHTTNQTRLESTVWAILLFRGCSADEQGKCNVVEEVTVKNPVGLRTPIITGKVWTSEPPPPGSRQLGQSGVKIAFGKSEALGQYEVIARVTDKVTGANLFVTTKLQVLR